eukprot:CAMPEP_0202900860 /NCGR_PEP_ID=MMETSP1392-20130828/12076_1 /ASSEMBLY_ACC=CAM_ASM_000868 /TAXON_ID=225041 /ORGANISM="Chlamydomonas chlamydogama, Strain SAG 11-48b" /LENGTH=616 /DNA_ID=CAMNT_0049587313 /DNA_START=74 /DNA_END=1924 /DNA_ORIENTATION=-
MAETEVEAPVAEVAEVEPTAEAHERSAPAELPPYDDSLLIKVKGKVKQPTKPDDAERNLAVEKLQAEIKKHGDRISEIKQLIDSKRNSSKAGNPAVAEHRRKIDQLRAEFQTVLRQKQHIREELQRAIAEKDVARGELRSIREKLPRGTKLETLEADIQQMEFRLSHESLSENEEKRVMQQVQALSAARPAVRSYIELESKLKQNEETRSSIKGRLDACDAVLKGIKDKEDVEKAALEQYKKAQNDETVDIPALTVEKQECWQIMVALKEKIAEIRDDYSKKYQEYIKLDKNYRIWRRHDERRKYEERQKAREARDADREANEQAATGEVPGIEPYASEILTIDQLLTYLRKFLATEDAAAKEEKKELEIPKGMVMFKRKDEDLDFFTSVKKGAKGGAAAKKQEKAAPVEVKKKLNHSLETLKTFMMLGVDVPTLTTEIPATIEKVEAKKNEYLEKRKNPKAAAAAANGGEASSSGSAAKPAVEAPAENGHAEPAAEAKKEKPAAKEAEAKAEVKAEAKAEAAPAAKKESKEEGKAAKESTPKKEAAAPAPAPTPAPAAEAAPAKEAKESKEAAPKKESSTPKKEAAKSTAAANGNVGVTVTVDKQTEAVSLQLKV